MNDGNITGVGGIIRSVGIEANTYRGNSPISVVNAGDISMFSDYASTFGFRVITNGVNNFDSPVSIVNSGDIVSETTGPYAAAWGVYARTNGPVNNPISIVNSGDMQISAGGRATGIYARTIGLNSPINIRNSGIIDATGTYAYGIDASTERNSTISIENSASITTRAIDLTAGIRVRTFYEGNSISIVNSGDLTQTTTNNDAAGILASALGANTPISIENSGDITTTASTRTAAAILAQTNYANSPISVLNSGSISATGVYVNAILANTFGSALSIVNHGDVESTGRRAAIGIAGQAFGGDSPLRIENSADITAIATDGPGLGIYADAEAGNSPLVIVNSGSVFGAGTRGVLGYAGSGGGIFARSVTGTTIVNSGYISGGSFRAINVDGASTLIYNLGVITGFVDLTDSPDRFFNQAGGVFETKLTSDFGLGNDLFRNEAGGTVQAATEPKLRESTVWARLERLDNFGVISMEDAFAGDRFRVSSSANPEQYGYFFDSGIVFNASGDSTLAVDSFLGGPGSASDIFIIDGDVRGKTALQVNNTNAGPGVFNSDGIPVVFVGGNVKSDAFFLQQSIDTGFFNYDLFFEPTGSGIFELRSFPGGGALLLPQLVTATQDIWHAGSSTWFDRTADLRVLLNGGGAGATAYDPTAKYADGMPTGPSAFTPAVWARGSGNWLDRERSETVTAYGRDYRFNLDRDLEIIDFQMGLDLGKRDLLSQGDILVFGMLGGFVGADLDYNQLARGFDFEGGQVGGYATYLRGGLFVDTLLNVHLLELETATLGFPSSLDATTVGLRTDTGYRFGSFNGGAFIEPLATLSVTWADIDGFSLGGNTVSFDDEANVRGRLGVRVGTSYPIWGTTTVEPFVIGSLWGNLSGDNQATLVSTGTTFRFEDDLDDVWGEVSAGVNFFNPSATTAVFAKLDVTFGDNVEGIGGKAGMRVSW
ncbi:MAG: autotransporter domain-containing protein [Methyloceanibacter sp.]